MRKYIKHFVALLCISFATVVVFQFFYVNMMNSEKQRCWDNLRTEVHDLNRDIYVKFNDEISKLHLIKTLMVNSDMTSSEAVSYLHIEDVKAETIFSRIDILYPDNTLLVNGELIKTQKEIDFERITEKGEYLTDRKTDFIDGSPCVYYVLPIYEGDEVASVLIGVIDCDNLYGLFNPELYNGKANICIIDAGDGNYIMDNWHDELGNAYELGSRELLPEYKDVDFQNEIRSLESGAIAFVSRTTGNNLYMYYAPLHIFGWEIAVFAEEGVIFSNLIELRKDLIITGIAVLVLLLLYCLWNLYMIRQMYFINREIESKQKRLEYLSYHDTFTNLYNRHKYFEMLSFYIHNKPENIGVVYLDLNGLKQINDLQSHEAGDIYIYNAAEIMIGVFGESCYRIGGDEFLVMVTDIDKAEFEEKIARLDKTAVEQGISFSIGCLWQEKCENVSKMISIAEKKMYDKKKEYHKTKAKA